MRNKNIHIFNFLKNNYFKKLKISISNTINAPLREHAAHFESYNARGISFSSCAQKIPLYTQKYNKCTNDISDMFMGVISITHVLFPMELRKKN